MKRRTYFTSAAGRVLLGLSLTAALASCSTDTNLPAGDTPAGTRTLTINCGIGADAAQNPGTRGTVIYGEKDESGEKFIWNKGDEFTALVLPGFSSEPYATTTFTIQDYYDDRNAPSSSVPFLSINFPDNDKDYNLLAVYPKEKFTIYKGDSAIFSLSSNEATQTRNTTDHLNGKIGMYGVTTVKKTEEPWINFHHLTSLFRFTVKNKNAVPIRLHKIEMIAGLQRIFGTAWRVKTPTDWTGATPPDVHFSASIHTLRLHTVTGNIQPYVSIAAASTTDDRDTFDGYIATGPGAILIPGKMIYFRLTVSDARDYYQTQRTYTSLALDLQAILDKNPGAKTFEAGKRYWFDLVLDDELTVGGITVSQWQVGDEASGNTTPITIGLLDDTNTQAGIFVDYGTDADADAHNVSNVRLGSVNNWAISNLWKSNEATPHIVIYSPYNPASTYTGTIDLTNGTTDHCHASINADRTTPVGQLLDASGKLNLASTDYKHRMCKVTIDFGAVTPTTVKLNNLYTAGTLTLNTGAIALTSDSKGGTSIPTAVASSDGKRYEIYVVPQDIDAHTELLTATIGGKNYTCSVGETALKLLSGQHHTLRLNIPADTRATRGNTYRLHGTFTLNNQW